MKPLSPPQKFSLALFLAAALLLAWPQWRQEASRCQRPLGGGGRAVALSSGPAPGRTGAPGETTCAASGCHTGTALNGGSGQLLLTGLPASYTPGVTYNNLQLTLQDPSATRWGFQLVAKDASGAVAGTLIADNNTFAQTVSGYLEHKSSGTFAGSTGEASWAFSWTAPATGAGTVTFYAAGNAANNNGANTGDKIYTLISPPTVAQAAATPPSFAAGAVQDGAGADADFTHTATSLTVNWQAATAASGSIAGYSVSLGLSPGGDDVALTASAGTATSHTFTGLNLPHGVLVYAAVRAVDTNGLVSEASLSDGVTYINPANPCNVDGQTTEGAFDPTAADLTALADIITSGADPNSRCAAGRCNFDGQQPTGSTQPDVGDAARLLLVITTQTGLATTCGP